MKRSLKEEEEEEEAVWNSRRLCSGGGIRINDGVPAAATLFGGVRKESVGGEQKGAPWSRGVRGAKVARGAGCQGRRAPLRPDS